MDRSFYTSDESDEEESSFNWDDTRIKGHHLKRLQDKKRQRSSKSGRVSTGQRSARTSGSGAADDGNVRPTSSASARGSEVASHKRVSSTRRDEDDPADRLHRDRGKGRKRKHRSVTQGESRSTNRSGGRSSMGTHSSAVSVASSPGKKPHDSSSLSDSDSKTDSFDINKSFIDPKALARAQAGKIPEIKLPLISRGRRSTNAEENLFEESSSEDELPSKSFDINNSYINPEDLKKALSQPDRQRSPRRPLKRHISPIRLSEDREGESPISAVGAHDSDDGESDGEQVLEQSKNIMPGTMEQQLPQDIVEVRVTNPDDTDIIISSEEADSEQNEKEGNNSADILQNAALRNETTPNESEAQREEGAPNRTLNDPAITLADVVVSENEQSFASSTERTFTVSTEGNAIKSARADVVGNSSDDVTGIMSMDFTNNEDEDNIQELPLELPQVSKSAGSLVSVSHEEEPEVLSENLITRTESGRFDSAVSVQQPAQNRISTPFPHTVFPFVKPLPDPSVVIPARTESPEDSSEKTKSSLPLTKGKVNPSDSLYLSQNGHLSSLPTTDDVTRTMSSMDSTNNGDNIQDIPLELPLGLPPVSISAGSRINVSHEEEAEVALDNIFTETESGRFATAQDRQKSVGSRILTPSPHTALSFVESLHDPSVVIPARVAESSVEDSENVPTSFNALLRAALANQKANPSDSPCLSLERIQMCPLSTLPATAQFRRSKPINWNPVVRLQLLDKADMDKLIDIERRFRERSGNSDSNATQPSEAVLITSDQINTNEESVEKGGTCHRSLESRSSDQERNDNNGSGLLSVDENEDSSEAGDDGNYQSSFRSNDKNQSFSGSRKSKSVSYDSSGEDVVTKSPKNKVSRPPTSSSSSRSQTPSSPSGKGKKRLSVSLPVGKSGRLLRKRKWESNVALDSNGTPKLISRATLRHMLLSRFVTLRKKEFNDLLLHVNTEISALLERLQKGKPYNIFTARELEKELAKMGLIPDQPGILHFLFHKYADRNSMSMLSKHFFS